MHTRHWINFLFLAVFFFASSAMAAGKLEKISDTPAAEKSVAEDCPMHHGKKECDHKNGEPCPYHQNEENHNKMHDKCEQKHRS